MPLEEKIQSVSRATIAQAIDNVCVYKDDEERLTKVLDLYSKYTFSNNDERVACIELVQQGNEQAAYYLVLTYWKHIVRSSIKYTPSNFPLNESLEIYINHLIRAAEKYEPTLGTGFKSYLTYYLWSASTEIKRIYQKQYVVDY